MHLVQLSAYIFSPMQRWCFKPQSTILKLKNQEWRSRISLKWLKDWIMAKISTPHLSKRFIELLKKSLLPLLRMRMPSWNLKLYKPLHLKGSRICSLRRHKVLLRGVLPWLNSRREGILPTSSLFSSMIQNLLDPCLRTLGVLTSLFLVFYLKNRTTKELQNFV